MVYEKDVQAPEHIGAIVTAGRHPGMSTCISTLSRLHMLFRGKNGVLWQWVVMSWVVNITRERKDR